MAPDLDMAFETKTVYPVADRKQMAKVRYKDGITNQRGGSFVRAYCKQHKHKRIRKRDVESDVPIDS
jgi:hypothetical protein